MLVDEDSNEDPEISVLNLKLSLLPTYIYYHNEKFADFK